MSTSEPDHSATAPAAIAEPLAGVEYFDGRSAVAHAVRIAVDGDCLQISGEDVAHSVPLNTIRWPERTRHGDRIAQLGRGGSLHCADGAAWDAWAARNHLRESIIVRMQQSWRAVLASVVSLVALLTLLWLYGVPWASTAIVAVIPTRVDVALGEATLEAVDEHLMRPSKLPLTQQQRLSATFERATSRLPAGSVPAHRLLFRQSRIGPNAFALPGGTLVLTDELVKLTDADEAVLIGVLGHELGHLRHRHGMRLLVQVTAIGAVSGLVLGDFSSLLAAVPVFLSQASYTRSAEREADAEAVQVLRAASISPDVMVRLFDKLAEARENKSDKKRSDDSSALGIAIASHPPDQERIKFFKDAAARP